MVCNDFIQVCNRYRLLWNVSILFLLLFHAGASSQQLHLSTKQGVEQMIPYSRPVYVWDAKDIAKEYPDSAIAVLNGIIENYKSHPERNYQTHIFEAYFGIAATYLHKNDYKRASETYQLALAQSIKTLDPLNNLCRALNGIGNLYMYQSNYKAAAQYYLHAASLAEEKAETDTSLADQLIRIYTNLSEPLVILHEYQKASYYLNKAEITAIKIKHDLRLVSVWNNKATMYAQMGLADTSWKYAQDALANARKWKYYHGEYLALLTLGTILLDKGKPDKAIPYLEATLRIKIVSNATFLGKTCFLLGSAYLASKRYVLAENYFISALKKAEESQSPELALKAHEKLAALYTETQNYSKALEHLKASYAIKDSLLNKEKTDAVQLMEVKYRTAEKDRVITQKELELNKQQRRLQQKNIWIGGITAGALILAVLLFAIQKHYKQKNRLNAKQQEIDNLKATMRGEEKERARIARELHDGITGMVTAVKLNFTAVQNEHPAIGHTENFTNAMHLLEETVHEIRYTSHNLTPEIIIHHELQNAIALFCEKAQKSSGLAISFMAYGVFEDLDNDFKLSLYRMTQELINNIVKHAQATQAIVQLSRHGNTFALTVEDDGIGWGANEQYGVGMQNIQSRVKSLEGKLTIETSEGNGTAVYIEFNLPSSNQNT